jgi:hypothetical protein
LAIASVMSSSPLAIMFATIGVSIVPGQIALMRTPCGAYSSAALLVSPMTPCLVAWYAARCGNPTSPPSEELLTIAPLPCVRIWRSSCFMQAQTPRRLTALTRTARPVPRQRWWGDHDPGVVERHIQPAELGDGLLDRGGDLVLV